jgi:hypothetical protein
MILLKIVLYNISPLMAILIICSIFPLYRIRWPADIVKNIGDKSWRRTYGSFLRLLIFLMLCFFYYLWLSIDVLFHSNEPSKYSSFIGLLFLVIFFDISRFSFESEEIQNQGKAPRIKGIFDLIKDFIVLLVCYTSTLKCSDQYLLKSYSWKLYQLSGLIFAVFILYFIVKFRIIDDIFRYKLYDNNSRRYSSVSMGPEHSLMRGIFDHFLRAYIFAAIAFSVIQLWIINNLDPKAFYYANSSSNTFLDFIYFNIVTFATVGYGDIYPVSAFAKMICIVEILFSVLIFAVVVSLIIGRFQKLSGSN